MSDRRCGRSCRGLGWLLLALVFAGLGGGGCGGLGGPQALAWVDDEHTRAAGPGFSVRWTRSLLDDRRATAVPVEQAAPAIDTIRGRVYVASTRGTMLALSQSGRELYRVEAGAALEAEPTLDAERGELYLATVTGTLLSLRAEDGSERWKVELGESFSRAGVLEADAIYLVSDVDAVVALSRSDGSVLWRYRRDERPEGFGITGHAGLAAAERRVITGFSDGTVVALDSSDGSVLWQTDTSADLDDIPITRRFVDVDTTPAISGDTVYVASFSGGLYGLELANGNILSHDATLKGVWALAASADELIVASAEHGVVCLDLPRRTMRWRRPVVRGAPGQPTLALERKLVYVPESLGGFLALSLVDGRERGRLETAHGITAPAALVDGRGFVLSNGGTLYAIQY
ncbi:MAG: PQQ-binding-like beta-propeller repeat protein [Myxococcales bacterium]|nr:PQQ-binding-like beta-propeller repeat protein [Myxococcales bacterium]